MKFSLVHIIFLSLLAAFYPLVWTIAPAPVHTSPMPFNPPDSGNKDTSKTLPFPFKDQGVNPSLNEEGYESKMYLDKPNNIKSDIEYDFQNNEYEMTEKIGDLNYRNPQTFSFDEYQHYDFNRAIKSYWRQRFKSENFEHQSNLIPQIKVPSQVFEQIFGTNIIDIKPQGSAELIFGLNIQKTDNPSLPLRSQRVTTFDFQEKIQMDVTGQIGDKLKLSAKYNTEASFEFENKMKLAYEGKEDEIIKKIEAGDVSLPLEGSLINGSYSLFGIKTELQFGKLTVSNIFSQQKGKSQEINVQNGAQVTDFNVTCDQYEANRHFFLGKFYYDYYDKFLENLPIVGGGITITRMEVWVTNKSGYTTDTRNVVAFTDLGEGLAPDGNSNIYSPHVSITPGITAPYPCDTINTLSNIEYQIPEIRDISKASNVLQQNGYRLGVDFEKIESMRMLNTSEYSFNPNLGYISLNSALNADEVLAVAYTYMVNGKVYQVGEFSNTIAAPNTLILKLIKPTSLSPNNPTWHLMMKNIYSIGAYQLNSQDFHLDVWYQDDKTGAATQQLPAGLISSQKLLEVLNMDHLNSNLDAVKDGQFDFIDKITINASTGRVIFPVREPFGKYLYQKITGGNPVYDNIAKQYIYTELYDSTQSKARQVAEKNKFFIKGTYKSASGSDISLNAMNIPQGSVKVTAGGQLLKENEDYTVDYTLGRVKIINQGVLQSGIPIKISLESQSLFNIQSKTLLGMHLNYRFNKDFNLGGTILNLTERPLTQKVNIGDEPISNTIWGLNGSYKADAPILTKMVDKLPFIETKAPSSFTVFGEMAQLIPGHSKAVSKSGLAYIDDFEGSQSSYDLRSPGAWFMASIPQGQPTLFPEGSWMDTLAINYHRGLLAWYTIDPSVFYRNTSVTPNYIKNGPDQKNHLTREVYEKEIWPNKQEPSGVPTNIPILNLAFYPSEKGMYNYSFNVNDNGNLIDPDKSWGGIMRKIETNDFEAANYEFIEFWLMDPFVYEDSTNTGGYLYFNLGDVSEDIEKDGRKSFENGFPTPNTAQLIDTTSWGRVPLIQSVINAFDNDPTTRQYQDIGLDGLSDADENTFYKRYLDSLASKYGTQSVAYQKAVRDPSNDDYHYFRGSDYDDQQIGILGRYKYYNGMEGNSAPTSSSQEYGTAATTLPNTEDINSDNTLSESENYFQYRVSIKRDNLHVGENYIVDEITGQNSEGNQVKWYQFKVPLSSPSNIIGSIQDFKSIRFMRMFLKGFNKNVVLRFATLDLVRDEWRKYNNSLLAGGPYESDEPSDCAFDISAVNIEENGTKQPVNYVLPPGVDRVIDPTNPQMQQLNEQAMVLKVCALNDGDARAVYKNVILDVRQYKKLQMFVHAEAMAGQSLSDNDLFVFVRIGSDYQDNYYEYEIPLKLTPPGSYDNNKANDREIVWSPGNMFDFTFDKFQSAKQSRNDAMRLGHEGVSYTSVYSIYDGYNRISVVGNPNLGNIKTVMIGIRNRSKYFIAEKPIPDDGLPKCAEVWINELRLSNFEENGGWATNVRTTARLADFGNVNVSGSVSTVGFGSIEQKLNERQKSNDHSFDISTNFELGKFLPEKVKLSVPMFFGYGQTVSNPQYNPMDPDITLKTALDKADKADRDSIKKMSQTFVRRKSLNFTNVKINSMGKSNNPLNPSNFALSYAYNDQLSRNINTIYDHTKNYIGSLTYNFSATPKNVMPFQKVNLFRKPLFKLIKDFNFYYMPSQFSFMTNLDRSYNENQLRNLENLTYVLPASYTKSFNWNRAYDLRYDITKSLKFDFHADNIALIDEPVLYGQRVDKDYAVAYDYWKDSVKTGILHGGRTSNYQHNFNLTYNVPINKIPLFNWINLNARYGGTYNWTASPRLASSTTVLGNTIKNSNTEQLSTTLNMTTLYNKIPVLKRINDKYSKQKKNVKKEKEHVQFPKTGDPAYIVNFKAKVPKSVNHKLGTLDVIAKLTDSNGKEVKAKTQIINENRIILTTDSDYKDITVLITGEREKIDNPLTIILENTALFLMGIKSINISYSENNGTILPGYLPTTQFIGMRQYQNRWAPGLGFVAGMQNESFGDDAANKWDWITRDSILNSPYQMNNTKTLNVRVTIEPIKNMRIELNANRTETKNFTQYYHYIADSSKFFKSNKMFTGSFTMTYNTWRTTFKKFDKDYYSQSFENFKNYRLAIAQRLAKQRAQNSMSVQLHYTGDTLSSTHFPDGYGPTSQEVLIPAFLAAYSGKSADHIPLTPFPGILSMSPNWSFNYTGLTSIRFFKRYFQSITLSHSYRSSYSVNSYTTNLDYNEIDGYSWVRYTLSDFIPKNEISAVSISEQFSPLFGIDITMKNSILAKVEVKRSRNLSFSLANTQINEMQQKDFTFGAGYRFKDLTFQINQKTFKSDLNLRANVAIRNDLSIIRNLQQLSYNQQLNQLTNGNHTVDIEVTADYQLGANFTASLFYKRNVRKPKISSTYNTKSTKIGFSLKFTLS